MVSAFTPNKFLEEPARGDYVGTWDTPVNSNIIIIDAALGGQVNINGAAGSVVLSSAQYRNLYFLFTGTLSAAITITFPPAPSMYIVQNTCAAAYTFNITLQTTVAGGQVICAPPGQTQDIYCDGSNIKYRNLGQVGSYTTLAAVGMPTWITGCTVPPFLNCDGTAFSSATYPILRDILGAATRPDARGRLPATLNQGTGRIVSASGGVDGNTMLAVGGGDGTTLVAGNIPLMAVSITDLGHKHTVPMDNVNLVGNGTGGTGVPRGNTGTTDTSTVTTGISATVGSAGPANFTNMPPTFVAGITMIRAA